MASHPVAGAPDVDDVAAVEQGGGHDLVVQDVAPAREGLVRGVPVPVPWTIGPLERQGPPFA